MSKHKDGFSSNANIPDDKWDSIFSKDKKANPDISGCNASQSSTIEIESDTEVVEYRDGTTEVMSRPKKCDKMLTERVIEIPDDCCTPENKQCQFVNMDYHIPCWCCLYDKLIEKRRSGKPDFCRATKITITERG